MGGEQIGAEQIRSFPKLSCRTASAERRAAWSQFGNVFKQGAEESGTGWCYDCSKGAEMIREGCTNGTVDPKTEVPSCGIGTGSWTGKRWGLETLMDRYRVDMYLTGHVHMYERSWPTLRGEVEKTYNNPSYPVHINAGNSGSRNDFASGAPGNFTAFRLTGVGCYSSVYIHNATHLSF